MSYSRIRKALQALFDSAMADKQEGSPGILPLVEAKDALNEKIPSKPIAEISLWEDDASGRHVAHFVVSKHELEALGNGAKLYAMPNAPIDMLLFCPNCGTQHIDEPKGCTLGMGCTVVGACYANCQGCPDRCDAWDNPPHRSHLCNNCDYIWRPADVPTNGVKFIKTRGKADHPAVEPVSLLQHRQKPTKIGL